MGSLLSCGFSTHPTPKMRQLQYAPNEDNTEPRQRNQNYLFYKNMIKSEPNGDLIEKILETWVRNYKKLENDHGYIQWLFPLKEWGMNALATPLQEDEIKMFREDKDVKFRLVRSYEMMLGFYGIRLVDMNTGEVERAYNWQERFDNLQRRPHNNLRITRIITSLSLLGCEHLVPPFVQFLATEIFQEKTLRRCEKSCLQFWIPAVQPSEARQHVREYVDSLRQSVNGNFWD